MRNIVLSQDFFPKIGGAHLWLYEVYKRWPCPVYFLVQDYSEQKKLASHQKGFDPLDHGAARIIREDIAIEDINLINLRCVKKIYHILRHLNKMKGNRHSILYCLRSFPEGIVGALCKLSRGGNDKLVTYAHGEEILIAKTSRQLKVLTRLVYKYSDLVIANSYSTKKLVKEICPSSKVTVIHPGVDTALYDVPIEERIKYRKSWGWPDNIIVLVTIARMEPRKNHAGVIKAMAELREEGLPLAYIVGGDGEEREKLMALVKELGLEHWVKFTGSLSESEKALTFASADIHVMPSIQIGSMIEGYGIVFLEAAAAGIPSIAGNIGGQAEAVIHDQTGLVIDGRDSEQVKNSIRFLAENKERRKRMGRAGRNWAAQFDWQKVFERTVLKIGNIMK